MHQQGYIGRKMHVPDLHEQPAIVIAAFGSTNRAKSVLRLFQERLTERYSDYQVYTGYTSDIIQQKLHIPSLKKTLAQVEADGYRKVVVQPLHIFPGTEYQQLTETCAYFPGLRIFLGETLLHRWSFIKEFLKMLQQEFLPPDTGYNLLALHGTPLAADPVNSVYLGLADMVRNLFANVEIATVSGVLSPDAVIARMSRDGLAAQYGRLKIIPLMYFAGMHTEEDLMGETDSWRQKLEEQGFTVECPYVSHDGESYFKGLGYYPEVIEGFLTRLERTLKLAKYY